MAEADAGLDEATVAEDEEVAAGSGGGDDTRLLLSVMGKRGRGLRTSYQFMLPNTSPAHQFGLAVTVLMAAISAPRTARETARLRVPKTSPSSTTHSSDRNDASVAWMAHTTCASERIVVEYAESGDARAVLCAHARATPRSCGPASRGVLGVEKQGTDELREGAASYKHILPVYGHRCFENLTKNMFSLGAWRLQRQPLV